MARPLAFRPTRPLEKSPHLSAAGVYTRPGGAISSRFVTGDYDHGMPGWRYSGLVYDDNPWDDYLEPWEGSTSPANSGPWFGCALIRAPEPSTPALRRRMRRKLRGVEVIRNPSDEPRLRSLV